MKLHDLEAINRVKYTFLKKLRRRKCWQDTYLNIKTNSHYLPGHLRGYVVKALKELEKEGIIIYHKSK